MYRKIIKVEDSEIGFKRLEKEILLAEQKGYQLAFDLRDVKDPIRRKKIFYMTIGQ